MSETKLLEDLVDLLANRTRDAMGCRLPDSRIPKAILKAEAIIAKERGFKVYHVGYGYDRAKDKGEGWSMTLDPSASIEGNAGPPSDTRRDVAERLEELSQTVQQMARDSWAADEIMEEVKALVRLLRSPEPSEGREPDADMEAKLEWLERTATDAVAMLDQVAQNGQAIAEWIKERSVEPIGTPSDSP